MRVFPHTTEAGRKGVSAVAMSRNGALIATGGENGTVMIWDADSGEPHGNPIDVGLRVLAIAFSHDGERIAVPMRRGGAAVWLSDGTAELVRCPLDGSPLKAVAFGPDGEWIVTAHLGGQSAEVWKLQGPIIQHGSLGIVRRGEIVRTLAHAGEVRDVSVAESGHLMATGGTDGWARVWDWKNVFQTPWSFGHDSSVEAVGFSSDGAWFATGTVDGIVRVWDADRGWPRV